MTFEVLYFVLFFVVNKILLSTFLKLYASPNENGLNIETTSEVYRVMLFIIVAMKRSFLCVTNLCFSVI